MRPFIILELLIAFALVSGSALPLIRYPMQHLSREIDALFLTELSRLAEADLAQMRIEHIQGKIDVSSLEKGNPKVYAQEKMIISLPGSLERSFEKKILVSAECKKATREGEVMLIKTIVSYRPSNKPKAILQADMVIFSDCTKKS